MNFYLVLVDRDFKLPPAEFASAKVLAHNLTWDEAELLRDQLIENTVAGHPTGFTPYVGEYTAAHAQTDPSNCLECGEAVLEHSRRMLLLLEEELANRSTR